MTPRLTGSVEYKKGDAANSQTVHSTTTNTQKKFLEHRYSKSTLQVGKWKGRIANNAIRGRELRLNMTKPLEKDSR